MTDRVLKFPPIIKPVETSHGRPLWSVMIPVYNCLPFLRQTLESVLAQDPGPEKMQIEVIDDCSTDGDVRALVQSIGKGRIGFFRQEQNLGHHRNFETCLNRSKGKLIHLLHGDDVVMPGFYLEVESMFRQYPQIGAAFTKNGYIDDKGNITIPEMAWSNKVGILDDFLIRIAQQQMLQVAAMVVKRSVYEKLGGFFGVNYCEDWEMWIRIAASFPVAYSPRCSALYRGGLGNAASITSLALSKGENFLNVDRTIEIVQSYLPADKKKYLKRIARKNYSMHIAKASNVLYAFSPSVAFKQANGALKMHQNIRTLYWVLKLYLLHLQKLLLKSWKKFKIA
jgi:glycosyltransferase involved in cell wall biosynthesis